MIGFIKGIFGSGKSPEQTPQPPAAVPQTSQNSQAFFLDADDARSMGNAEYMRTVKAIRRTFPKTLDSQEEKELIAEISSMIKRDAQLGGSLSESLNVSEAVAKKIDEIAERRRTDTSMDMFRNMARDMKKR